MYRLPVLLLGVLWTAQLRAQSPCLTPSEIEEKGNIIRNEASLSTLQKLAAYQNLLKRPTGCRPLPDTTVAQVYNLIGVAYFNNNQFDKALEQTAKGYQLLHSRKSETLGKIAFNLGFYHTQKEEYSAALPYFIQAGRCLTNPSRKSLAFKNAADVSYKVGDFEQGTTFAMAGIEAMKGQPFSYEAADAYNILGVNLYSLDHFDAAKNAFQQADTHYTAWAKKSGQKNLEFEGALALNLGNSEKQQKQYDKARDHYLNVQSVFAEMGDTGRVIRYGFLSLGINETFKKDYIRANNYYQAGADLLRAKFVNVKHEEFAMLYGNWALLKYTKLNQQKQALIAFRKALDFYPGFKGFENSRLAQIPNKAVLQDILSDYGDCLRRHSLRTKNKKYLQESVRVFQAADQLIDFMRYEHAGEGSKLFWRQKTRGMYEHAIEACYLAGDMEQAFRFFEKSKAVLLADKLNELGANQQLPEADAKRQKSLRDSISNLQSQLASLAANDKKRSQLQSRLERFNDDFEAFRKNLEKTNPAYYRYKYDNSTPSIATFKEKAFASLGGKGAFVSYFLGDSAVYAFTLRDQAKLVRLSIKPADYQSLANEFLNLCADRAALNAHYARYRTLAYSLYQHLWQPLGITEKRVIISSDGEFLPFEALLSTPTDNAFLLKQHAISYTYSANYLIARLLKPKSPLWALEGFVGFAPETFATSLNQATLNGSKAALEAVENTFFFGKTFTNTDAGKAQFLRSAPTARVIQLFTHAEADPTETAEPTIYFQDAPLRLSELNQTEGFDAQLLVLSACKTGVGQNQRGEGVFSLARGFAALGIGSTVTTLWNVEDQPTYELTKLFYGYLEEGLPKDEALQRAKLEWIEKGGKADALPSQWAGMILVGDVQPLARNHYPLILGGVAVLLLVGSGIGWRKKRRSISR